MSRCVIISGGDFYDAAELRRDDYVIACDKGYEYALRMGVSPDYIIGDFDSYSGRLPVEIPTQILPCEKDDTDTVHAIKFALEKGFDEILLICSLGGRLDHLFANIQSCAYAARRGASISMKDEQTELIFLENGKLTLPAVKNCALSLFSLSQSCTGVSERGVKYPLDNATLDYDFPLGVSNEWAADMARISVESGTLMIMIAKK